MAFRDISLIFLGVDLAVATAWVLEMYSVGSGPIFKYLVPVTFVVSIVEWFVVEIVLKKRDEKKKCEGAPAPVDVEHVPQPTKKE